MTIFRTIGSLALLALVAGCCTRPVCEWECPELPPRPALPTVEASELECLDDETYRRLVERQAIQRSYWLELEGVILACKPE